MPCFPKEEMKEIRMSNIRFLIIALACIGLLPANFALAGEPVSLAGANTVNPEIQRIQDEAEEHYRAAFTDLDYDEYIRTAQILEGLLRDYGTDPFVQDAYFYLADIYHARLQGEGYSRDAIRVLKKFIETFPYLDKSLDAQMTIGLIYYRHLNELDNAIDSFKTYFDILPFYSYLESEKMQAQLLLAKCYQKRGNFSKEKRIWDGFAITHPNADSTGRYRFLNDINNWKRLTGDGVSVYFQVGIPKSDYLAALAKGEAELKRIVGLFGKRLPFPVELYLYADTGAMVQYTHLEEPLPVDSASEIHLTVNQTGRLPHLIAQVYSSALNNRPRDERHQLMRGGLDFCFYVDPSGRDVNTLAARYLSIFEEPPSSLLLLRESTFFGSPGYNNLAGSFCAYLVENEPVSHFVNLYQGLYPRHTREMVEAIFEKFYGKPMDDLVAGWYRSLSPLMAKAKADMNILSFDRASVELDLSTPETALAGWYESMRNGDYDALIDASTPDLRGLLEAARDAYEDEGIFDEVVIGEFVYPYYATTYNITGKGPIGDEIYFFKIEIVKTRDSDGGYGTTFAGSGQKVIKPFHLDEGSIIIDVEYNGDDAFTAVLLNSEGEEIVNLAALDGSGKASKALRIEESGDYMIDVSCINGGWKIAYSEYEAGNVIEEKNILLRKIKKKWYVDTNP